MFGPRIFAVLLACGALMASGTSAALALPAPASSAGAPSAAHLNAVPGSDVVSVTAADTAQAAQLLGLPTTRQVGFVPVCYYVYRYMYYCAGGRCAYVYRYVYVCN